MTGCRWGKRRSLDNMRLWWWWWRWWCMLCCRDEGHVRHAMQQQLRTLRSDGAGTEGSRREAAPSVNCGAPWPDLLGLPACAARCGLAPAARGSRRYCFAPAHAPASQSPRCPARSTAAITRLVARLLLHSILLYMLELLHPGPTWQRASWRPSHPVHHKVACAHACTNTCGC